MVEQITPLVNIFDKDAFAQEVEKRPNAAAKADTIADAALAIDAVIEQHRIVNWINDNDVQNQMRNEIEDSLFRFKDQCGLEITFEDIDTILEQCLDIARVRRP